MLYLSLYEESIVKNSNTGFLSEENITVIINKHKHVPASQHQMTQNVEHFHQQVERLIF